MTAEATLPAAPAGRRTAQSTAALLPALFYLAVEVARPMDWVPALGLVRPGLIAALWGAAAVVIARRRPLTAPLWLMLLFAGLLALQVPFAVNNHVALWGFIHFAVLVVGYVIPIATLPLTRRGTRLLLTAYVVLHLPVALHSIVYEGRGTGGWMGDENDVALALNVAIGAGFYLLPLHRRHWVRILLFVTLAASVAGVVASRSRGGFVGLAALVLYLLLAGPRRGRTLAAIAAGAAALALFAPASYWHEVETIRTAHHEGDTGAARFYYWGMAWEMFLDHPIAGVGTDNYGVHTPDYEDALKKARGGHAWGRAAHSLYMTLLAEQGIAGTLLFLALLAWCWRTFRRLRRAGRAADAPPGARESAGMASAVAAGLFALLVTGTFLSVLYYPVFWILAGFLVAVDGTAGAEEAS